MRSKLSLLLFLLMAVLSVAQFRVSTTTHSVSLNWQETTTGVTFNVYRGTSSGGETPYASGITTLSYTDNAVSAGQWYFYYVTAVNSGGESKPSNEISVKIPHHH